MEVDMEKLKVMKLSECKGVLRIVAQAMIRAHGYYICKIKGEKIKVVA